MRSFITSATSGAPVLRAGRVAAGTALLLAVAGGASASGALGTVPGQLGLSVSADDPWTVVAKDDPWTSVPKDDPWTSAPKDDPWTSAPTAVADDPWT
jgi:hypothetical protein